MEKIILFFGLVLLLGSSYYQNQTENEVEGINIFREWQNRQNIRFTDNQSEMYRFNIFMENYKSIIQFNTQNDKTYSKKINKFAHLNDKEFAQIYLNLDVPYTSQVSIENYEYNGNSIDWTEKGKVPAIKDQGQCGSCWAFSAVGALEVNTDIQFNQKVNLSEQDLVDCAGPYGNAGCDGGWMDSAFDYVQENGLALGKDYPYTATDGPCKNVSRDFKRVKGIVDLNGCSEVYEAIQEHAISVGVDATNWRFYDQGIFNDCKNYINHGVVVVGIDSNGVWKIRNSWGTDWGVKGYIQLASGDTCGICIAASYPILK